jgi:acyl-CoA thioester hydrolase
MTAQRWTVTCEIRPRFRDTDAMGHINNAVYISYLEVGRQAYWAEFDRESDYRRVPFTLARVACDFRSEALVKEVLEVGIRCTSIGTKSFAFEYVIREKTTGRLVVEATTVQVCYDYATKRSVPMPDELRRRLEAFEGRSLSGPKAPA